MYGLPQAGILANQKLTKHLAQHGYHPTTHTPGLWKHNQRPIWFSLVVDNFGVKYIGKEHADHLLTTISLLYNTTTDWTGALYCGLTLKWDYEDRTVDVSMPGYVAAAIHKFQHPTPTKPQHAPYKWTQPTYGQTTQSAHPLDESKPLASDKITRIQKIVGTLLYYARAVDSTMLLALGTIASKQAKGTEQTAAAVVHLLNYCATHPEAIIRYYASEMTLHVDSDASYLSMPQARSRAGGYYYLSLRSPDPTKPPTQTPPNNGTIHAVCTKLKPVMASATEAKVGALFVNGQEATVL
jgi:hypothetical protein